MLKRIVMIVARNPSSVIDEVITISDIVSDFW